MMNEPWRNEEREMRESGSRAMLEWPELEHSVTPCACHRDLKSTVNAVG